MSRIGRNASCPCGSGLKFKRCCYTKVPWDTLVERPLSEQIQHISLRGRNLEFIGQLMDALQIDSWKPQTSFAQIKRAFTPQAVRKIFEAIPLLWPSYDDLCRLHARERSQTSALYTGSYEPEDVFKALVRHSAYSERIFLTDPFLDPRRTAPQFNPVLHPDQHRANAVKCAFLWLNLWPWIEAGIVNFVRPPADFIPGLWNKILELQRKRFDSNLELKELLDAQVDALSDNATQLDRGFNEWYWLSHGEEQFREIYDEKPEPKPPFSEFLAFVQKRKDEHPYFVEPIVGCDSEIVIQTSGACYELAKMICGITNSHVITNLKTRWKEVEIDRGNIKDDMAIWTPFAKALQNAKLQVLDSSSLEAALTLRKENRLEGMRLFFRKVWLACRDPDEYGDPNSLNLAVELNEKVAEAKTEWAKIDQDVFRWFGPTFGSIATAGFTGFAPAALAATGAAVTGIAGLVSAQLSRKTLRERYPAAFFLGLPERE